MEVVKGNFTTFFYIAAFHYKRKDVLGETSLCLKENVFTFFSHVRCCLFV